MTFALAGDPPIPYIGSKLLAGDPPISHNWWMQDDIRGITHDLLDRGNTCLTNGLNLVQPLLDRDNKQLFFVPDAVFSHSSLKDNFSKTMDNGMIDG